MAQQGHLRVEDKTIIFVYLSMWVIDALHWGWNVQGVSNAGKGDERGIRWLC